jgi:simple sugar transport system permease protein/D-ribose pyranase
VLGAISGAFIAEKVSYAAEMAENNPPLLEKVKRIFPDSNHEPVPHAQILGEMAAKAKVIVRTGAFDPWGNILLYSGVDAPVWFSKPGLNVPEVYAQRVEQMKKGEMG